MDSRADEDEEKFPVHTLVSITAASNTRLVCFHLHKPTPARPFGKHGTLASAQFFLPGRALHLLRTKSCQCPPISGICWEVGPKKFQILAGSLAYLLEEVIICGSPDLHPVLTCCTGPAGS